MKTKIVHFQRFSKFILFLTLKTVRAVDDEDLKKEGLQLEWMH